MALQTLGSQIAQRYLSGWFFIDFISILPYDLLSLYADEEQTGVPLQLLKIVRLTRLAKVGRPLPPNPTLAPPLTRPLARPTLKICVWL